MQASCDFISSSEVSSIEDSRYAFFSSYEVLRDRYNKLKGDYKKLLIKKTCCRCATHITHRAVELPKNLRLHTNSKEDLEPQNFGNVELCHSPEAAELIRDVTLIRDRLARVLSSPGIESDLSSLSNAVDSLYKLKRQLSFSVEDTPIEECFSERESAKSLDETRESLTPLSAMYDNLDSSITDEEIDSLISTVNKQNKEIKFLCEKLKHQNGMLISLTSKWQSGEQLRPGIGNDVVDVDDWSIIFTR